MIAFDAAGGDGSFSASPNTWSHTCTGSDLALIVAVFSGSNNDPTSVTYAGVSMTKYTTGQVVADGGYITLWYLLNPASGTNTVSVTDPSGSCGGFSASYTGVLDAVDSFNKGTSGASPIDATTTVVDTGCWLVMTCIDSGSSPAAGTATTARGTPFVIGIFDSDGAVGTGSQALQATYSGGNNNSGFVIASLSPSAGGGGGPAPMDAIMMGHAM